MSVSRRDVLGFMSVIGASTAVQGVVGCGGAADEATHVGALTGTEDSLRRPLYPPFPQAEPLGFEGQLRNGVAERDYIARVDGKLPSRLRGTLFRNGPGVFERGGVRKGSIVDGDGMIRRYRFNDGQVTFRNRFVRTPKYLEETAAGRFIYDTWTTELPVTPDPGSPGQAGVTPVLHNGTLYAFDEVGAPYTLDPTTLDTRGLATGFRDGWNFKAHTRMDEARGEWVCIAEKFGPTGPRVQHTLFDKTGAAIHSREVALPLPGYMHDFFLTDDWVIYFNHPALIQPELLDTYGVGRSLKWVPSLGTQLVLVPRHGAGDPIIIPTEARWMWHSANAFQHGGVIVADYIGYDTPDHFLWMSESEAPAFYAYMNGALGRFDSPGRLRRMVIDPVRRTVRDEVMVDGNGEFPMVSRAMNGRAHRFIHHIQMTGGARWWNTLTSLDTRTGGTRSFRFPAGHHLSEPVFAPDPKSAWKNPESGWLLVPVFEEARQASSLAIFRSEAPDDGPIAAVRLEDHDPFAFHGWWQP